MADKKKYVVMYSVEEKIQWKYTEIYEAKRILKIWSTLNIEEYENMEDKVGEIIRLGGIWRRKK